MVVGIEGIAIKMMTKKCVCNRENWLCWMMDNSGEEDRNRRVKVQQRGRQFGRWAGSQADMCEAGRQKQ